MANYYGAGILNFIRILFEIYIAILMVRFLLDWFAGKLFNPVYRFIYKITQPPIGILQKYLPNRRNFNVSCLIVIIALELIELIVLTYILIGTMPGFAGLLIWCFAALLSLLKAIFFWSIIIYAVLSWVSAVSRNYNPLQEITGILVAPVLRPIQKILPTLGGFDLSPIVAFLALQVINFFVIVPLLGIGQGLAL
jgi:YggT family protein